MALAAAAGLLLSVVLALRGADAREPVAQVVGEAAVSSPSAPPAAAEPGSEPRSGSVSSPGAGPAGAVGRSDASVDARGSQGGATRPPLRVRVPSVDLDTRVQPVGVARDRQMRLPDDPRVLGWYRYGPAPGDSGSVVVAGHVDSEEYGVGPLVALQSVEAGALVEVVTAAGRARTYRVDSIERFDRQALPGAVFSRSGPERLRLITCTGPYLPQAGGYQQNLVVTAVPA